MKLRIASPVICDSIVDGPGLRMVIWTQGCKHNCKGCHNPVTWDPNGGLEFDDASKKEIFDELEKSYISGITFSGGDPLHMSNAYEVTELAKEIKEKFPKKTVWLYTGALWEETKRMELINYVDVLVDGEFECDKKDANLHWKGSSNQRVIDVKETLKTGNIVLHA